MKNPFIYYSTVITTAMGLLHSCGQQAPQFGSAPIDDVIGAMTLEEKATFLVGSERLKETPPDSPPSVTRYPMFSKELQAKLDSCKSQEEAFNLVQATSLVKGRVQGAAGQNFAIPRLGIPSFIYADGPAGLRIDPLRDDEEGEFYCTAFPIESALSASWDTDLVQRVTAAMGQEVREYGVDVLLAPAINIHRNPLCGRNFEYFSEDPLLTGRMASAYINGIQSNNVGVSLKHFAVNNQETHRNGVDAQVSMRAMREIYLRGFEIAVKESQPWTIMSSYNKINGTFASENHWLLTELLRDEWGYQGFVMTDWWAQENGARQMAAGNDLIMPGTQRQFDNIIEAVRKGELDEKVLDTNIRRMMNILSKTSTATNYKYSNQPDLKAHAQVARQAATECMVLLENRQQTLPLSEKVKRIAAFGNASYDILVGGSGSGNVNRKYKVSLEEGLQNAGIALDEALAKSYGDYVKGELAKLPQENFWTIPVIAELPLDKAQVQRAVANTDLAVVTICRMAGEGGDRKNQPGDFQLSEVETSNINLICSAAHAAGKRVVVLLNMGNIIDLTPVLACKPDAVLHVWMGGQETGNSIADVLTGKASPSGKLPMTWAKHYEDYSSANDFPFSDEAGETVQYKEGVMVGYRHFDTRAIKPLYPFGYGLSYTTFLYSDIKAHSEAGSITLTVEVRNNGQRAGREAVQFYVSAPASDGIEKPVKELKAFAKTPLLQPGESATVKVTISASDLASWDESTNGWNLAKGTYRMMAAASADDIRCATEIEL